MVEPKLPFDTFYWNPGERRKVPKFIEGSNGELIVNPQIDEIEKLLKKGDEMIDIIAESIYTNALNCHENLPIHRTLWENLPNYEKEKI